MEKQNLTPFQIAKKRGSNHIYIVNTNTGEKGAFFPDGPLMRKALKRLQAKWNSSYALDRLGIY